MAIPDYQACMRPLLRLAADEAEHTVRRAVERLAIEFRLDPVEQAELLTSGTPVFVSRVGWAATYLRKAGLLESTRRGYFRITPRGLAALSSGEEINTRFLERYPEFVTFQGRTKPDGEIAATAQLTSKTDPVTPEEAIESSFGSLRGQLAEELLQQIMGCSPAFFERLVVEVLVRMGYGGSRRDAGQAIGRSGDGGIDGIIKEDALGLDTIYIQAKRWEGTVGRPEIQRFVGALQGQRARKGVFITTSTFSADAERYASMIENKVVLMDGEHLASLMIDHGVGVSTAAVYEVKRVDSDYFVDG